MKGKVISFLKNQGIYAFLSFLIPVVIMIAVYAYIGIYPGSEGRTILASDAFSQYSNFHASFNNMLKGEGSIFYTWSGSMGLNYWAFISYYLGGVFTPLVFFFNNLQIPDYLYYLTLLKIGCLGLSFWVFSSQTFKLQKLNHVLLSISYALMSFVLAFSEILMWFDALMYLPLVVLGIHRLMDQRKPTLLFVAYVLLLISNFYMAFMVGVFSVFYFLARLSTDRQRYSKQIGMYVITSLLAGGASMVTVLPTFLDVKNNGESLSAIKQIKTDMTGPWDLIIKNMVGVYDSTKFDSIPYIYVGLLGLTFCLYYFVTKKILLKEKIAYGSLIILLIASFYIEPLNLAWQGLHTPNMFLFRFSFLFSFMILLLAGYGWEKYESKDFEQLTTIISMLVLAFIGVKVLTNNGDYSYLTNWSFVLTIAFIMSYLFLFYFLKKKEQYKIGIAVVLVLFASAELGLNSLQMIVGISEEWHYPSRKYYAEPYPDVQTLVDYTKEKNDNFYRLENLDAVSLNDSFNYGYHGVSMFSSIRNRHSSYYLNALGYRSLGTNLNIRYENNTLLMDSLIGMKYNISKQPLSKFGFEEIKKSGDYRLYENNYALPLGILTDDKIYEDGAVATQATLFNHLAEKDEDYFTFEDLKQINSTNVEESFEKINQTTLVTYTPETELEPMEIEWEAKIPAYKQVYFSVYPTNRVTLGGAALTIEINEGSRKSVVSGSGQYYDLGFYENETTIRFKTIFSNVLKEDTVEIVKPDLALLDTNKFKKAFHVMEEKGVSLSVDGRRVEGKVNLKEDQVLLTTIPYDKGWKAYIDGKRTTIPTFKEAFLTLPISAGEHNIEFVFLPQGLLIGFGLLVGCTTGFIGYLFILKSKKLPSKK